MIRGQLYYYLHFPEMLFALMKIMNFLKNLFHWISFSNSFRSPQSSCLKTPLAPKQSRDQMRLPGEMFPADVQCQLQFGPKSRHSILQEEQDICTDLHCTKDHFTWTSHSALEGTACGFRKVFLNFRLVYIYLLFLFGKIFFF